MAETPWVSNITGALDTSEQTFTGPTAINIYGAEPSDDFSIFKRRPGGNLYPHRSDGSNIGYKNTSFVLNVPGIYKITGTVTGPVYITFEAV